jgi:hypothetical protein
MAEDIEPIYWTFRPLSVEKLKQCVQDAFADVIYPGDDNITISSCPCQECRDTREFFRGRHWREVVSSGQPLQPIGWGGLAILSPQAWRFYLPAYILVSLSEGDGAEEALDCALYSLSPVRTGHGDAWFTERAFALSVAQQECIRSYACAVLESLSQDEVVQDEAVAAAAIYWKGRVTETKAEQVAV